MNCPLCKIKLRERKFKNIYGKEEKAYQCFQCGGIFLQNLGGLRIDRSEAKKLEEVNLPLLKTKFPLQNRKFFNCPLCLTKMEKYINPKYKDFLILFCSSCKGMFFNHGELLRFSQKKEEDTSSREKEILRKIYESQGKEAVLKAIPIFFQDEAEIKKRMHAEIQKETAELLLKKFIPFLIPFVKLPGNIILNIFLTLIPFLKDIEGE